MQTLSRTSCIFILLSVSVYWNCCACRISLCTDDTTSSQNGTSVPAKLGAPVGVSFCVRSEVDQIHSHIQIQHPNHRSGWYFNMLKHNDNMHVIYKTLVPDDKKAIICITILHAENQDFKDVFKVSVHTVRQSAFRDTLVFWFGLKQEDSFEKVSFTITNRNKSYTNIQPGDDVDIRCLVNGCPGPILLKITDDINQTVAHVPSNSSLVTEIRRVQCSDMGSYYCRAEAEDGGIIDSKVDLAVRRCPVQLCRGEETSKIIFAAVKDTVNFSLCLISAARWLHSSAQNEPNKISVNFTRREPAGIYWTADITIYNIQDSDYGNKTISIRDRDGSFEYHFQLKDPEQGNTGTEEDNTGTFVAGIASGIIVTLLATLIFFLIRRRGHQIRNVKAEDADKNMKSLKQDNQKCSLYENTTRELSKEEAPPCSQYEEIRDTAHSTYEEVGNVKLDMSARDVELKLLDIQDVAVEYQNTVFSL